MRKNFPVSNLKYPLQAEHFRKQRTALGKTQEELCRIIDRDLKTYRKWEKGQERPDCEVLIQLSELYGVSADYLLGLIEEKNHDLRFVCEYTGLKEDSVSALQTLRHAGAFEYIRMTDILLQDSEKALKGAGQRSILSLLYYFFSIDRDSKIHCFLHNSGLILKLDCPRPPTLPDSALYFDPYVNESAALVEIQTALLKLKQNMLEKKDARPEVSTAV